MINLPKSTEVNSRIPKQSFYENTNINPRLKEDFKDQIKTIYLKNKLSKDTINLEKKSKVEEILFIELNLNTENISEEVLKLIDKSIPYHLIFILNYEGKSKYISTYKEIENYKVVNINKYFSSNWELEELEVLKLDGLDLDTVYENFIKQISKDSFEVKRDLDLKTKIEIQNKIDKLKVDIERLEIKIKKEKQLNKQMEMSSNLRELRKELEEIYNG